MLKMEIVARGSNDNTAQLLYFTCSSLTAGNRELIFVRVQGGHPNLFALDLASGRERALTFNSEGTLKSYVYFRGQPDRGFGRASMSLDAVRGRVYFIQGRDVCCVDIATGEQRTVARLPEGQVTAFTHVSADGRRICVPTTDARALDDETAPLDQKGENLVGGKRNEIISDKPTYDIDERVRRENLSSYLRVFDTASGAELLCERVPRAWITHVQFSPANPDWILYNHEWPSDCGIRRLWLWDGRDHRRLRTEENGRSRADWSCHEMWTADGAFIIYHGKFADGTAYIGRVSPAGGDNIEIALPKRFHRYGHFTSGTVHSGWLVSDGYWHPEGVPENDKWGGEWITLQKVDWEHRHIEWVPLCPHHSAWDCQDSHPHPIYNHGDTAIYFTTNSGGGRSVARVAIPHA